MKQLYLAFCAVIVGAGLFLDMKAPPGKPYSAPPINGDWAEDVSSAFSLAKKTKRGVMMYFYSSGRRYHNEYPAQVFELPQFRASRERFVFVGVDLERRPSLGAQYGVARTPTILWMTSSEKRLAWISGFDKDGFFKSMKTAERLLGK